MRLRTTRERFRSGSTRQARGYEESRQGVVKYQYFSTPGNEKYFRRFALFRSRLDGSSEQLSLLEPGRSKSNEFSLCATSLICKFKLNDGLHIISRDQYRIIRIDVQAFSCRKWQNACSLCGETCSTYEARSDVPW